MEYVLAAQQPDDLSLHKAFDANRALLLSLPHFHLFYSFQTLFPQPQQLFLQIVLLQSELNWILQHQLMESGRLHPVNRRFGRRFLSVVISFDDSLVLVLPVDEIEVVFTVWVEFDWSVRHKIIMRNSELFIFSVAFLDLTLVW